MIEVNCKFIGSCRVKTIAELYNQYYNAVGIPLEFDKLEEVREKIIVSAPVEGEELQEKEEFVLKVLQNAVSLERVAYELVLDLANEGLTYAEINLIPSLHTRKGLSQREVVDAVLCGIGRGLGQVEHSIKIGLVLGILRQEDKEVNHETILLANRYKGTCVCGLRISGTDDGSYPLFLFGEEINLIRSMRFSYAVDADDEMDVIYACDNGARRIFQGLHASLSKQAIHALRTHNVILECSAKASYLTKKIPSLSSHPMRTYAENNVLVIPCSYARTTFGTNTKEELFDASHILAVPYQSLSKGIEMAEKLSFHK